MVKDEEVELLVKSKINKTASKIEDSSCNDKNISPGEDSEGNVPVIETEAELRKEILLSSISRANDIYKNVNKEEHSKSFWRKYCILFFSVLLLFSLVFVNTIIVLIGLKVFSIPTEIVLAIFTYAIVNMFTIIYVIVKYISNNQYLESFKTVTYRLLDYLSGTKASDSNSVQPKSEDKPITLTEKDNINSLLQDVQKK